MTAAEHPRRAFSLAVWRTTCKITAQTGRHPGDVQPGSAERCRGQRRVFIARLPPRAGYRPTAKAVVSRALQLQFAPHSKRRRRPRTGQYRTCAVLAECAAPWPPDRGVHGAGPPPCPANTRHLQPASAPGRPNRSSLHGVQGATLGSPHAVAEARLCNAPLRRAAAAPPDPPSRSQPSSTRRVSWRAARGGRGSAIQKLYTRRASRQPGWRLRSTASTTETYVHNIHIRHNRRLARN